MKKVLIITNHSYMLYQFRKELIEKLMEQNEVVLSMPFVGHEEDFMNMGLRCIETNVDRRGINPITDVRLLYAYWKILRQERPDMVITYSIKPNIYAGIVCSILGISYCANVQGLGTAFQKRGLAIVVTMMYKIALYKAKKVFFENKANAMEFRRRKIVRASKEKVLHGAGVNLEKYNCQPYPDRDTEESEIHFLYLGRIMREKGIDELFAAFRKLHGKYGSRVILDLVGFFEDEYKEQVEQLEKEGMAIFYGFQEDPRPFYAMADCVVLPSYHEGMSNVLLEAAATGRPLITSNIPGCREAVEDNVTGYLCRVKSRKELYQAMEKFVTMSREEREKMGLAGRVRMEQLFDREKVVEETVKIIYH